MLDHFIKVLVIEKDIEWVKEFTNYLDRIKDIKITGEARNIQEGFSLFDQIKTDIILMSIKEVDNWDGLNRMVKLSHDFDAKVILLNSGHENHFIFDVFKEEKIDYIDTSRIDEIPQLIREVDEIPQLIREVYQNDFSGKIYLIEKLRKELIRLKKIERLYLAEKKRQKEQALTPTEIIILQLIDQGYTRKAIAKQLIVSINTIKKHISSILDKMKSTESKEAAKKAKERGLI